jgi:PleD family two-component response regulator
MGDKGLTVGFARLSESTAIVEEPRIPARQHVERPPISAAFDQSSVPLSNPVSPRDIIESTQVAPRLEKLSVLVADDNSVNLSIFKRRLEKLGHEVKTSLDGQECFDAFQEHRDAIHFILMDINVRTRFFKTEVCSP